MDGITIDRLDIALVISKNEGGQEDIISANHSFRLFSRL